MNYGIIRRRIVAIAILLASPFYVFCGLNHICMAGHMQHPPYSIVHHVNDALWVVCFVVAGVLCWKSNIHKRKTTFVLLLLLFLLRIPFGSAGGGSFILELPLLIVVAVLAIRSLCSPGKDFSESSQEEKRAHRRKVAKGWGIAAAVLVAGVSMIWGGVRLWKVFRQAASTGIEVSKLPFSLDITLKPGDAYTFKLPNDKTVAVWCTKNTGIIAAISESDIGFQYGEKPFEDLEREVVQLPGGATTGGEYLSYIRQGSVYDGGAGNPSEYILYVEKYRISLKEKGINNRNLPMTVSVRLATEKEQANPKQEVDYYFGKLSSPDPDVQINAMEELRMLLMLGSMYAEPRWKEIIEAVRPLSLSPNEKVKAKASEELLIMGDVESLMTVMIPEPKGKWRTDDGARSLATYSKHFGKERIYEKVLPFLESKDPELFRFAMAFFSYVDYPPVKPYMQKALKSDRADIRLYAFHALFDFRAERNEMARLVNTMLDDTDNSVLKEALREAGRYNQLIPPEQICKHLKHQDKDIRHMAAYALDCCRNTKVIGPLLESTKDKEATVREQAAVSLGRIGNPKAYPRLIELLEDEDSEVRQSAINGLRWFGNAEAIPKIKALAESDPDENVRKMANRTIRELSRR